MSKAVRSMNGRILRAVVGAAALGVLLTGCIGFTVQKDVDGDPDDENGPWVVRIECTNTLEGSTELVFNGEDVQFFEFEASGPGDVECTVEETDDGDADEITIECVEPLPPDVICAPFANGEKLAVRVTNNDSFPVDVNINIKVTNEYDPPTTSTTTSTTTTTTAPPAAAAEAAAVSPTFTG
jgi:hypothetical protein